MARGNFREVNVGGEAGRFQFLDLVGTEVIAEILGNGVGIGDIIVGAVRDGDMQAAPPRHLLDPFDEQLGVRTLGDLSPQFASLLRLQRVVDVSQQCSQRETDHVWPSTLLVGAACTFRAGILNEFPLGHMWSFLVTFALKLARF